MPLLPESNSFPLETVSVGDVFLVPSLENIHAAEIPQSPIKAPADVVENEHVIHSINPFIAPTPGDDNRGGFDALKVKDEMVEERFRSERLRNMSEDYANDVNVLDVEGGQPMCDSPGGPTIGGEDAVNDWGTPDAPAV